MDRAICELAVQGSHPKAAANSHAGDDEAADKANREGTPAPDTPKSLADALPLELAREALMVISR